MHKFILILIFLAGCSSPPTKRDILLDANETASNINDPNVRQAMQDSFAESLAGIDNNIAVNNGLFQYSFIVVLITGALFLFLYSRRLVESGYGFV